MTQYIAFLRGINVGGHNVKMDMLRGHFETIGCVKVETFIASGNVIFESRAAASRIEAKIEQQMADALGYDVATFVRRREEVRAATTHSAFPEAEIAAASALCVGFLKAPLTVAQQPVLQQFSTDIDAFHAHERELYWLCRVRQSESKFSNVAFEKKLGVSATFRSITTMRKLAALYPPAN